MDQDVEAEDQVCFDRFRAAQREKVTGQEVPIRADFPIPLNYVGRRIYAKIRPRKCDFPRHLDVSAADIEDGLWLHARNKLLQQVTLEAKTRLRKSPSSAPPK